jgi:hypothetical protein
VECNSYENVYYHALQNQINIYLLCLCNLLITQTDTFSGVHCLRGWHSSVIRVTDRGMEELDSIPCDSRYFLSVAAAESGQ